MLRSALRADMRKNFFIRGLIVIFALTPLIFYQDFYRHFYAYLSGGIITNIITREWHIVILSILAFVAFLIPLSYRRKANWVEYGLVSAFFVSLFIEMYGIPLTILFASKYLYSPGINLPSNVIQFYMFGVGFGMDLAMSYAAILMIVGTLLIITGWVTLYRSVKNREIVTNGIYAFSRHPQYLGFIMVIAGWFIGWPTIISLIFVPILVYKYIRVCRTEEREIAADDSYQHYREKVPFFI